MTELLYLLDTYNCEGAATLISIDEDEIGPFCTLDRTIFHPQGGGQPSDSGQILRDSDEYAVKKVSYVNGKVHHYLNTTDGLASGQSVRLIVDKAKRLLHARVHTTGHLISSIAESMDIGLIATKGYHFPDNPYVEFLGSKPENPDSVLDAINAKLSDAISNDQNVTVKMVTKDELAQEVENVPDGIPNDKPLRIMAFDEFPPMPCGGTHLRTVSEIGTARATKLKAKKGNVKISYECP